MYNIDWSDDIATENVKEQFATLRPVLLEKHIETFDKDISEVFFGVDGCSEQSTSGLHYVR